MIARRALSRNVKAGKILRCALRLGVVLAIGIEKMANVGLFDLSNQLAGSIAVPLSLPLLLGFFYPRLEVVGLWSTVAVGFGTSWLVWRVATPDKAQLCSRFGASSEREVTDAMLICSVAAMC